MDEKSLAFLQALKDRGYSKDEAFAALQRKLTETKQAEPKFEGTETGRSIAERMRQDKIRTGGFMEAAMAQAEPGIRELGKQYQEGKISGLSAGIQTGIRTAAAPISRAFGEVMKAPFTALAGLSPQMYGQSYGAISQEAGRGLEQIAAPVVQPTIGKVASYAQENFPVASSYLGTAASAADIAGVVAPAAYLTRNVIGAPVAEGLGMAARAGGKAVTIPAQAATKYGTEVLGKVTGTSGETVRQAFKSAGEEGFTSTLRGTRTADDVLNDVRAGMQQIKDQRSLLYGEDYAKLKESTQNIDIAPIRRGFTEKLTKDYRVGISEDGNLDFSKSTITGKTAQRELQEAFDDISRWDETTPVGLDVLKRRTADRWRGVEDSRASDAIITGLKNDIKDTISREVPEYSRMSATYEKISKDLKDIEKTLSLGRGVMPQTSVTKLNSVLRENFAARKQMVELLEQYTGQGIFGQVAGLQLNSFMGRGLMGLAQGGAGLYGVLANPAILVGLAASSPRLIGEVANALGKSKKWLQNTLNNVTGNVPRTVETGAPGVVNPLLGKKGLSVFDDVETLRAAKEKRAVEEARQVEAFKIRKAQEAQAAILEENKRRIAAETARREAPGGSLEPKLKEIFNTAVQTVENVRSRGSIEMVDILVNKIKTGEITLDQAESIVAEYVKKRVSEAPAAYRDQVAKTAMKEEAQIMDGIEKATQPAKEVETPVLAQANGQETNLQSAKESGSVVESKNMPSISPRSDSRVANLPAGVRPIGLAPKLKGGSGMQVGNFTKIETEFGSTQLPLLDEYKGFKIVEDADGSVSVYNPKMKTMERVAVDDTKDTFSQRVIVDKHNTLEVAKEHIDYLTGNWSKRGDAFRAKNDPSFGIVDSPNQLPLKEVAKKMPETYLSEEDYLAKNGAGRYTADPSTHMAGGRVTDASKKSKLNLGLKEAENVQVKRDALRAEYRQKIASGEIKEASDFERLKAKASGHIDNESTRAAQNLLEKKYGYVASEKFDQLPGMRLYTGQREGWIPKISDHPLSEQNMYGNGVYLTPTKEIAEGYAGNGGRIYETAVDIKNPLKPGMKDWYQFINRTSAQAKHDFLVKNGYDAVVDVKGKYKQVMIIDPKQIKIKNS